jgi:short-subunit dehydrogenase
MTLQSRVRFRERYGPWALVAGGSEGIGRSFAMQLAERGLDLLLVARRDGPLQDAAAEIRERCGVQVVAQALDLTAPGLDAAAGALTRGREVGLLVCNAGATHGAAMLLERPVEAALALVRLNCVAPLTLTHMLGARMRERGRGGVIFVSSMAGLAGGALIAAYAAAKAFEIALAEALWYELGTAGVDVLGLVAGATLTPAMLRSGMRFGTDAGDAARAADGPATSTVPMDPDDVVREALEHLGRGPIHVAGEANRRAAQGLRSAARDAVVTAMSAAVAEMYGRDLPARLP